MQIYRADLFEMPFFIYLPKIIPLLINGTFVALACFFFYSQKKKSQCNVDDFQVKKSKKVTHTYTDSTLIDHIPNLFCIKDQEGRWIQASDKYLKILNLQYVDYIGKTDTYLALKSNSNNSAMFQENMILDKKAWKRKRKVKKHITLAVENGTPVQLEIISTPVFDENNRPSRLFVTGHFLRPSQTVINEFDLLTTIFSTSHLSFIILNADLKIVSVNAAFSSLLGYSANELKDQLISSVINSEQKEDFCTIINAFFRNNDFQLWSGEIECKKKNKDVIIGKLEIKPVLSKKDTFDNYFVTLEDVTLVKQKENRILNMAHHDHLTGLVNRAMFMDRMAQFLSTAKRHNLNTIIFFLDLDKFKIVNDSLGHDAGDDVLKETAKRLLTVTRKEDVVARFSGDEFAILLSSEKTHEETMFFASLIADKIIKSLAEVYYINRRELFVGSSIGISIYPEDGNTAENLLKNADIAMYRAKNKGRNNYQFYKKEFSHATQDRLELEHDLRKAISTNELQLFYQPQYHARTREISGAEVLIRWFQDPHGENKIISPEYFIPIAEETGLVIEMGNWILNKACGQMRSWLNQGFNLPQISVNVSARQFMDEGFIQSVEEALEQSKLEAQYLELEITESMLIGDLNKIELQLKRLKKMGIKIALDDFGTGYSSLSYLKKFSIDVLKIDQSFIREMTVGSKDASIAYAIIEMGHSLGQKIVAEGVENETQLMILAKRKCDFIQGYYFSKPLPVYKMNILLKENSLTNNGL